MKKIKNYYLYITVFATGAVVLVIEIVGTKLIAPLYGSTIYVWSSLIVVTMGALALGYLVGGRFADRFDNIDFLFNIILAAGVTTILLPTLVKPALLISVGLGLKFGPLLASLLIFFVPLLLLGTVTPLVIKEKAKTIKHIGNEAGKIFSVATLGSLTGGLTAGFFLAPVISSVLLIVFSGLFLIFLFIFWQII